MALSPDEEIVLGIFKEFEIETGEYLSIQTFERERTRLPQEIRNNWSSILRNLTESGYIIQDRDGLGLTQKGYLYLNPPD